jgi:hypothetical protein
MTGPLILATTHLGSVPSPLTILLAIAAVGYMLWSRMKGQPLRAKRLLVLPVVLTVIGVTDLSGSSAPHLTPKDIGFLVASVAVGVVLGAARGATIELYPNHGELWQRYRPSTVGLWVTLIVTRVVVVAVAGAAHASAGGGTNTLLVSLGASLAAEAAIVGPRALSTGLPFAVETKGSDGRGSDPSRSRASLADRFIDGGPPPERFTSIPPHEGTYEPAPPGDDAGQWRSPGLRDGIDWLRHQLDQSAAKGPTTSDERTRNRPGHGDHDHHHRLSGPS